MSNPVVRPAPVRSDVRSLRGFGLVELMVSMAIGLVIIAALVVLFTGTSRNNREMASASNVIENGRFAIQLLENDLVHAGYWGTWVPRFDNPTVANPPGDVPTSVPDPCLAYNTPWNAAYYNGLLGIPVQAYEADDALLPCAAVATDRVAGSDVLIVRHAEMCVPGVGDCEADIAGNIYIQSTLCATESPPYFIGTNAASFTLTQRNCADLAEKRKFVSNIYYVRNYAATAGDRIPTLVRSEFNLVAGTLAHQAPVPLIEGIETLRVEVGVDNTSVTGQPVNNAAAIVWADPNTKTQAVNRGDGIPDGLFVRCTAATACTAGQLTNATAVRIYVLARSREATNGYVDAKTYTLGLSGTVGPFNDGFKRHVYSTTARLINISGRRERP